MDAHSQTSTNGLSVQRLARVSNAAVDLHYIPVCKLFSRNTNYCSLEATQFFSETVIIFSLYRDV